MHRVLLNVDERVHRALLNADERVHQALLNADERVNWALLNIDERVHRALVNVDAASARHSAEYVGGVVCWLQLCAGRVKRAGAVASVVCALQADARSNAQRVRVLDYLHMP
jgi:hypothetical protein